MSISHFPHSLLLFSKFGTAIVASGHHIQSVDTSTGTVISSTVNASDELKNSLSKSGPIRFIAVDHSWKHLLTLCDDKKLKVWKVEGLELLHERELPKRPTSASFTADGQTIVVADKFGDVFSYTLHPLPVEEVPPSQPQEDSTTTVPNVEPEQPQSGSKRKRKSKKPKRHENPPHARDSVDSHTNPSGGTLVLGHTSLLTTFIFSQDEKYIITADRDEHIRISWYPQGYIIESFCLGCSQFVSCLHIPKSKPNILISGGGDPELKVWDWLSGKLKFNIPVSDCVKEYIKVKAQPYVRKKFKRGNIEAADGDDDGEGENEEDRNPRGEADLASVPLSGTNTPTVGDSSAHDEETIVVVQNIETVEKEGKLFIIFSVVGATALFTTAFPEAPSDSLTIHAFDFGHPVLDFTLDPTGFVWATIDRNLTEGSVSWDGRTIPVDPSYSSSSSTHPPVRVVEVGSEGIIAESSAAVESSRALLEALTTTCLLPCSQSALSTLNFYSSLTSLPKNNRGGEDGDDGDGGEDDGVSKQGQKKQKQKQKPKQSERDLGAGRGKKEEGKMKSKIAVLEKQRQIQGQGETIKEADRETKRLRSEVDETTEENGLVDVEMEETRG
ncbi:hypothetical protein E1B28_007659 [Marasmius oreades]|uniref:Transfer RNA methyltransferase 82 n=1 Tax=Marasmius oreades TaxID=181124 RepID=A0A9P7UU02_9AGAR|nr:uncharacterized protein E1B28_007659 [Marasmius oreades]KAG7094038.1 hypothetical protein E1B28_007659 [Marasmius oreades]